jgi:hypothetical protein
MARSLAPAVVYDVIETKSTRISFKTDADSVQVSAGSAALDVALNVEHSPTCGAVKWFSPLSPIQNQQIGLTRSQEWSGSGLGSHWRLLDRKSSFVGSFEFRR